MAHTTIIARVLDGLILTEMQDGVAHGWTNECRPKALDILKRASGLMPRCSIDWGDRFVFNFLQCDGVCFLAMFDQSFPRNYAFAFLEDVHLLFQEELKREFGTGSVDYRSRIDTIEKPFHFVKLDRQILRKKAEYRDPSSSRALSRLHAQLTQVSGIMQHNLEELLMRGENLEDVTFKAKCLSETSQRFSSSARLLALSTLAKKFGALLTLVLFGFATCSLQRQATSSLLWAVLILIVCLCFMVLRNQSRRSGKVSTPTYGYFSDEHYVDSVL
jgi:vesicle transport protein SEC22